MTITIVHSPLWTGKLLYIYWNRPYCSLLTNQNASTSQTSYVQPKLILSQIMSLS